MKHNQGLILSATVLATLAMGATTLTANAATTYKRSKLLKFHRKLIIHNDKRGRLINLKVQLKN